MSAGRTSLTNGSEGRDVTARPPDDRTGEASAPDRTLTEPERADGDSQASTRSADTVDATAPEVGPEPKPAGSTGAPAKLVYPPVAEERPSSRPVLAVALLALLLLVAVGVLLIRQGLSSSDSTTGSGSIAQSASGSAGAKVNEEVSFGPGLVVSESQHVVFDQPVSSVTLTVPKQAAIAGGGAFDPRIGNLQILLRDGSPVSVRQSIHTGTKVIVDLPAKTTSLDVVYVAYRSVVRSQPSSQHRAAALVTPLTLTPSAGMTSTLHINGRNVSNIGCISPSGVAKFCGSQSSAGWTITRGPGQQNVAVIAQLDLRR
jgi:hypothetical protein